MRYDASIDELDPLLQENITQKSRRHKTELHSHPDDEKKATYRSHAHFTAATLEDLEQIVKTSKAIGLTREDISSLEKTFNAAKKIHQCAQGEETEAKAERDTSFSENPSPLADSHLTDLTFGPYDFRDPSFPAPTLGAASSVTSSEEEDINYIDHTTGRNFTQYSFSPSF